MLLPTKGISAQRALLTVGARVIRLLESPATVSGLWERFIRDGRNNSDDGTKVTFDWFALSLAMLNSIGAVEWNSHGQLERCHVSA